MSDQASHLREAMARTQSASAVLDVGPLSFVVPRSMPTGAVSFAPMASGISVSASPVHRPLRAAPPKPVRLAHAIAVVSGKGGVGKSNLAVNLAVSMSQLGLKTCLLDADLGMANTDVLCSLSPKVTLEHVVNGSCRLADAMMLAPGGFRLIPGASGVSRMADLPSSRRQALLEQLAALERVADVLLIDCGAGIGANVLGFAAAASAAVIVTTPEPTALTDAYGMIKMLARQSPEASLHLAVNMASGEVEGRNVFDRVNRVCRTFLGRSIEYAGCVPSDHAVSQSVRRRMPVVLQAPDSAATAGIRRMAASLAGKPADGAIPAESSDLAPAGFFTRLAQWMGIVEVVD